MPDLLDQRIRSLGFPSQGKFRVFCYENVQELLWAKGDYDDLDEAKKSADESAKSTVYQVYSAFVYAHNGQEVYVTGQKDV